MNINWQSGIRIALWACIFAASTSFAAEPAPVPPSGEAPESLRDPEAEAILMGMANFLSKTQRLAVDIRSGYDVVQDSGQKIEFGDMRRMVVARPDRMRVDVEDNEGDRRLILIDGKQVTVYGASHNVYAQSPVPGDLDKALGYFVQGLRMRLPLAAWFLSRLPAELDKRVRSLDYVGKVSFRGFPAHHLAARADAVDLQVWVADGDKPVPLRAVLTYREAEGQPQFWAEFSGWDLAPKVTDEMFAFTPPQGAQKIAFLRQLRGAGAESQQPAAEQKGVQP
jgi:hypothetical protein